MDTWWNEAIEQQAIDRVHRLGQNKPVFVTRYIIKGTVEKRIMKIRMSPFLLCRADERTTQDCLGQRVTCWWSFERQTNLFGGYQKDFRA
jgi:hypothetical protein